MEILNQNQRRSAMWRIAALGILILAMLGTTLYATHQNYASQGVVELEDLKEKYRKAEIQWKGKKTDLENQINNLKDKLEKCKKDADDSEELAACKRELRETAQRLEWKERDLDNCNRDLANARAAY